MQTDVARKRFTVDEYYRMLEAGILHEGDRVELIGGEILEMTPIGARHAGVVFRAGRELTVRLGRRAAVRIQSPIHVDDWNEPEPDIAIVHPREDDYTTAHPKPPDVLFLIEVADTTLRYDTNVKLPLYAEARIPEVWIVDLNANVVTVFRDPHKSAYDFRQDHGRGDSLSPDAFPGLDVPLTMVL